MLSDSGFCNEYKVSKNIKIAFTLKKLRFPSWTTWASTLFIDDKFRRKPDKKQ